MWDGEDLKAAAPLYRKDHSYGEYVFDWTWADAHQRHGVAYYPKWLVAVPFTPVPGPRLLAADGASRDALAKALHEHAVESGLSSLHALFVPEADARRSSTRYFSRRLAGDPSRRRTLERLAASPRLAPSLSAKALSAELNRRGRFPERLWVFDERIGSLLFYLDPPLCRDLTPSRVENVTSDRLLSMRQPPPGVVIAVRAERLAWLARRVDLSATPFTPAGRYRVYTAEAFHAAVAQATRRR